MKITNFIKKIRSFYKGYSSAFDDYKRYPMASNIISLKTINELKQLNNEWKLFY
ncbi:MAG TPA: hypothetical protein QF753_17315 [Victivallales bacterium]|nr:hypothetical protein [Victivallales bacterium]